MRLNRITAGRLVDGIGRPPVENEGRADRGKRIVAAGRPAPELAEHVERVEALRSRGS